MGDSPANMHLGVTPAVSLNTVQPIRDPGTGWRCHSAGHGGAIRTTISARLKRVQQHSSAVKIALGLTSICVTRDVASVFAAAEQIKTAFREACDKAPYHRGLQCFVCAVPCPILSRAVFSFSLLE